MDKSNNEFTRAKLTQIEGEEEKAQTSKSPYQHFPLFLYIYRPDGYHTGGKRLNNKAELEDKAELIKDALKRKVEVRITDTDDCLVFHAKDGKILFPTPEQIKNETREVKLTPEEEKMIAEWAVDWQINRRPVEQIAKEYEVSPQLVARAVRTHLAFIGLIERNSEELSQVIGDGVD